MIETVLNDVIMRMALKMYRKSLKNKIVINKYKNHIYKHNKHNTIINLNRTKDEVDNCSKIRINTTYKVESLFPNKEIERKCIY